MRKLLSTLTIALIAVFPLSSLFASDFTSSRVIERVKRHSVAVIVHYTLSSEMYRKEVKRLKEKGVQYPDIAITYPEECISYVGAGTILPGDHVITVNHLLNRIDDALGSQILIQGNGWDKPIRAIVVYRSKNKDFCDDYALLRMAHSPKLSGITIANRDFKIGDKYLAVGSSGGFAYLMRFGFVIPSQKFFKRNEQGELKIGMWEKFPYTTIYPGAPGDSGGGVFNRKGELVTIMYCGVQGRPYVYSNPNVLLKNFLIKHGFSKFIKGHKDDDKRVTTDFQQFYR